jgi:hypothetical protein
LKQPYKRLTTKERLRSKKVYEFIGKGLLSIREVLFFVDFTSFKTHSSWILPAAYIFY